VVDGVERAGIRGASLRLRGTARRRADGDGERKPERCRGVGAAPFGKGAGCGAAARTWRTRRVHALQAIRWPAPDRRAPSDLAPPRPGGKAKMLLLLAAASPCGERVVARDYAR